jgi:hypothetical protein
MCLLVAQKPNQPLGHHLVDALLRSIHDMRQRQPISVDGFPAEPDHLKLLPAGSTVINFDVPDDVREARLTNRSEHGPRKWVQGGQSLRDASLPALLSEGAGEIQTIDAKVDPQRFAKFWPKKSPLAGAFSVSGFNYLVHCSMHLP